MVGGIESSPKLGAAESPELSPKSRPAGLETSAKSSIDLEIPRQESGKEIQSPLKLSAVGGETSMLRPSSFLGERDSARASFSADNQTGGGRI